MRFVVLMALVFSGCLTDNRGGVEVTGYLDGSQIQVTSRGPLSASDQTVIVSAGPGDIPDGLVMVENSRTEQVETIQVESSQGLFVELQARLDDAIRIDHANAATNMGDELTFAIPALAAFPQLGGNGLTTFRPMAAPLPETAAVKIELVETLPVGSSLFAANVTSGQVVQMLPTVGFSYQGVISALQGDPILVYLDGSVALETMGPASP